MKNLLTFILLLLALLLPATATAHDFEVNGIYYNINGTNATVTYKGSYSYSYEDEYNGDVTIPSTVTYNGTTYSVTTIGNYAFYDCSGLTSVTIPNSVTTIGDFSFYDCSGLTSVTIPNSVTTIGNGAFYGCSGLTSVTIPNSVTSIGYFAFESCSSLTSVDIGESVTSIGDWAFAGCCGLTSVTCLATTPPTIDNYYNYDEHYVFPSEVTSQATLYVPEESVTAYQSAYNWKDFSQIVGISETPSIDVFEVDGIWYLAQKENIAMVIRRPGEDDYYQGNVVIPESVTFHDHIFTVASIDDKAFKDCSVTSVTIGNSVTYIGTQAFEGCCDLTSVIVESGNTKYDSRDNCNAIIETASNTLIVGCMNTVIPNSVITIGESAFYGCRSLTSVSIPNSVTTIGSEAFYGCSSLTSVTIGNSVTTIGSEAFYGCRSLTSVSIPNSVTTIGSEAFYGCSSLTSVTIGNSVTTIGESAFYGCSGLTSVSIPNSVTSIGSNAFYRCRGLTSVTIGNSVIIIGDGAFFGCIVLTNVTIGNSVTTIGENAFDRCYGLNSVTCLATTPPTIDKYYNNDDYYAFPSEVTRQATLYVPEESVLAYQSAYNWKDFSQIVGITEAPAIDDFEVDGIWYRALDENNAMVIQRPGEEDYYQGDVVIPEAVAYQDVTFMVTSIDAGAFEDCYDLTSVVIGDAVESIGENAFQGCTALTNVTIGNGMTAISSKAFNYCNALKTVICCGMVPPVMASSNCFTSAAYTRATLCVPRSAQAEYSTADYWYKFNQIEGYGSAGPGDVNGDGIIGIADITALIDYRLYGETNNEFYFESADLNGNGRIDIADISTLIDMMLFGVN